MLSRKIVLPVLTLLTLVVTPQIALAEFLSNNGSGGYYDKTTGRSYSYDFELWTNDSNTQYRLKIWRTSDYPHNSPFRTYSFASASEALNFFDRNYTAKVCDLWQSEGVCVKASL